MAVVQTKTENEQNVSLPRRIAAYIASMNFAKVFRRHHPRESSIPVSKSSERPSFIHHHHRYPRPFSYHIPTTEQLSPTSLTKISNVVPYRIGLSSDSTLLTNAQTNEDDEIVRLPIKNGKGHSPKIRKDRRFQSQLNTNKRWLFRSMETLDGWKGKVFQQKNRTTNSSQSRSRSVENLADGDPDENNLMNHNPSTIKQQRAVSPNRSIETITNRVISSIGIHRKSTNSIPNIARSPALTIKKQSLFTHSTNALDNVPKQYNNNETNSSAILDFREISSSGFLQSRSRLIDENENSSLTPSENNPNGINSNDDDEHDEVTSNLSFLANGYDHNNNNNNNNQTADSWDFSITWIDSLKEQHSPQRKIQFYENLIKLLEQDTLNIDELLVLRKVLAKIWPTDETKPITTTDYNNHITSIDSKTISTKSLHAPNKIKRRSKLSTMTHHTAQRCSAILEQPPTLDYEPLHEQNSGHVTKPSSVSLAAKAKPCIIENNNEKDNSNIEQNYPEHLNPFDDEPDITPSAPPKELDHKNNESIRRYFERLTLLETIYEKINIESNKTPLESVDYHQKLSTQGSTTESTTQKYSSTEKQSIITHPHTHASKKKFSEMNVDGNGSLSSGKSSLKRRAPTAPHLSQNGNNHYYHHHHQNNPAMFTLSSTDLSVSHKTDQDISIPIRFKSHDDKFSKEISPKERIPPITHDLAASCDEDGHVFVYDSKPNQPHHHINEEQSATLPKRTERIHEWLSSCEIKDESDLQKNLSLNTSPKTQLKLRCIAKPIRHPSSSSQHYHDKQLSAIIKNEIEPGRFRSSLKIHLETNEPINHRSRVSSATTKHYQRQPTILDEDLNPTNNEYFPRHSLSPSFQRDQQAVYL